MAREVGTEGKLGGQANVKGVGGTWKDLTDSVNSMAGNLTAQVRNIADVATAVAASAIASSMGVEVIGVILDLEDNGNRMVVLLRSHPNARWTRRSARRLRVSPRSVGGLLH